MNPIQHLHRDVLERTPGVDADLDAPKDPNGRWFLDLRADDQHVVVEWTPRHGFGISASERTGFGEAPEETYTDFDEAESRVLHLLRTGEQTSPPRRVTMRELRSAVAGLTQETLAGQLGVEQAAISKLERRTDTSISTLRRALEVMGAELELVARFPNEAVVIAQFDDRTSAGLNLPRTRREGAMVPVWSATEELFTKARAPLARKGVRVEPMGPFDTKGVVWCASSPSSPDIFFWASRIGGELRCFAGTANKPTKNVEFTNPLAFNGAEWVARGGDEDPIGAFVAAVLAAMAWADDHVPPSLRE